MIARTKWLRVVLKHLPLILLGLSISDSPAYPQALNFQFKGAVDPQFGQSEVDKKFIGSKLSDGDRIKIMNYQDQARVSDYVNRFVSEWGDSQHFYPNKEYENDLIRRTREGGLIEVINCRVFRQGSPEPVYVSPRFDFGGPSSIPSETGAIALRPCLEYAAKDPSAYLLEETHTHPSFEALYGRSSLEFARQYPLNDVDVRSGRTWSRIHPGLYWRQKAVVLNGYYYTRTLLAGELVADPFSDDL